MGSQQHFVELPIDRYPNPEQFGEKQRRSPYLRLMQFVLIDDNPIDNFIHRKMLAMEGLQQDVIEFHSADEALAYFVNTDPASTDGHFILLDLKMPGMDGIQFLGEFRKLGEHLQKSRVVVLTSSITDQDKQDSRAFPFVIAFENKPLSPGVLKKLQTVN